MRHSGKSLDPAVQARKRMENIVMRRKLMDLVSAQGDEIEFLRTELDRLRRRTFPSFTRARGSHVINPDEQY